MGLLREVFGPSKEEVWKKVSKEIEADFVDRGFFRGDKLVAKVKDRVILLIPIRFQ